MVKVLHGTRILKRMYYKGKKLPILGYGSQGHAHAQNLKRQWIMTLLLD